MSKIKVIDKNALNNIMAERNLLSTLKNEYAIYNLF